MLLKQKKPAALCGLLVLIALAACAGGTTSTAPSPVPCPLDAGAVAIPAPPDMLYPMPNATGVPDGNFTLVAGYGNFAPPTPKLVPVNGGAAVSGGAWGPAPTPLPSPAATPRFSGETLYGSAIPALSAHTNYNVEVTVGTPPCQTTETAGSFTTQ
jgi:hypothetical protein